MSDLMPQTSTDAVERCPNHRCRQSFDDESRTRRRCRHCGCVMTGNQIKRKYPKPPSDADPAVALQLLDRANEIIVSKGGRDHLSPLQIGNIERFVVLEAFVQSWESFFLKAGIVTKAGRVRSGFAGGYMAALNQLTRLGQVIGLDTVTHEHRLTPEEWLMGRTEANADDNTDTDTPSND